MNNLHRVYYFQKVNGAGLRIKCTGKFNSKIFQLC
jgi:hypothetical protein